MRQFECQVLSLAPAAVLGLSIQIYVSISLPLQKTLAVPNLVHLQKGNTKELITYILHMGYLGQEIDQVRIFLRRNHRCDSMPRRRTICPDDGPQRKTCTPHKEKLARMILA